MSVEEKVKDIIAEQLSVDRDQVTDGATFVEDLKADSLDFIEVKAGSNAKLSKNESVIKTLIENGKVRYRVIEGKLPAALDLKIRA